MKHFRNMIFPYILWALLFIVAPFILIIIYAFTDGGLSLTDAGFSLDSFRDMMDSLYFTVFMRSFETGLITTALCFLFGYPMAYFISKLDEKIQPLLILLTTIPTWINLLLRTYAWIGILSDNGILNMLLKKLSLPTVSIMYTGVAVNIGLVCNFLPFMILPIYTSLSKMDPALLEAAYDLGANKVQAFIKVVFKYSIPGVLNGVIITFLMAISAFVIPKLLGGGQYTLLGNLIENQFVSVGNWNFGSAISFILAVIILLTISFLKRIDPDDEV
ncbi:MAG: ABC transporter permease [Lachnospiraceae bacterium]|nr:ABC transporter permease [Lachnospiraceae bacterium]